MTPLPIPFHSHLRGNCYSDVGVYQFQLYIFLICIQSFIRFLNLHTHHPTVKCPFIIQPDKPYLSFKPYVQLYVLDKHTFCCMNLWVIHFIMMQYSTLSI